MTDLSVRSLNEEMLRLSGLLTEKQVELVEWVRKYAESERTYRKAKAVAFMTIRQSKDSLTVPEREAAADSAIADERRDRDEAEGMKMACLAGVRSLQSQLSALQSIAAAYRSEAEVGRYDQGAA